MSPAIKKAQDSLDKLDTAWVLDQIATGIDLQSKPADQLTRGEQWKIWLNNGERTKYDLIEELAKAPGKPKPNERISDIPVPYYSPGPVQWEAHNANERVVLVSGGWRGGKSKWLAANLLYHLFRDYAYVWIVGPEYEKAREEFSYIKMWLDWLDVPYAMDGNRPKISMPQQGGWALETAWHAKLETVTGSERQKIEMANLNAAGIAEAGYVEKDILNRLRGRVMQKRGFIYISGSMDEAQPWYVNALKQYKNGDGHGGWRSFSIPSYDNLAVYPMGEKDEEIETLRRELPEDEFARKILALPAPPTGLVFKEFDPDIHVVPIEMVESSLILSQGTYQPLTEGNSRSIAVTPDMHRDEIEAALRQVYSPFSSNVPMAVPIMSDNGFTIKGWRVSEDAEVEIAVDPGWEHGYAVLAIVRHKDAILVIDEVYEQMKTGEEVINECRARPWWPRVKRGVIDRAGTQHQMNMSEHEKWRKLAGLTLRYVFVPIPDGISRYRTFLFDPSNGRPRLFVSPQCDNFIWEHSNYRYPQYKEGRAMRELPIDAANHAIKALTYYIVVNYGFTERTGGTTSRKYIEKKTKSLVESRSDWMYQE